MKQATSAIPIVFLSARDPIRLDVVTSFARPGRNMTGVTFDTETEMYPKRLQLLKESVRGSRQWRY